MTSPTANNLSLLGTNTYSGTAISQDGKLLAFTTADAFEPNDKNKFSDIYIRNQVDGVMQRVSVRADGVEGNQDCSQADISTNNRYIVFTSSADNLVAGDTNGATDIFRKDLQTGELALVSQSANGTIATRGSETPSISADGRYVSFSSAARNLVTFENGSSSAIFRKDMLTGEVILVSTNSDGKQANGTNIAPAMSDDGKVITFFSTANNLGKDIIKNSFTYAKNLETGTLTRLANNPPNNLLLYYEDSVNTSISADGRYAAFTTKMPFVDADSDFDNDVYVRDLQTNSIKLVSGSLNAEHFQEGYAFLSSMSADGRYVMFTSLGTDLYGNQPSNYWQLYVKDLQTGMHTQLSKEANGTSAKADSYAAKLTGDGKTAVFISLANNLSVGATPGTKLYLATIPPLDSALENQHFNDQSSIPMRGLDGDDTYRIDSGVDSIIEEANGGIDVILTRSNNITLPANVEQLVLFGDATIGTGNELDNYLRGTYAGNTYTFSGGAGNDTFYSVGINENLDGGTGRDSVQIKAFSKSVALTKISTTQFILESSPSSNDRPAGLHQSITLNNMERIQTYDDTIALDITGNAGQAYRIYQAAFNRTPDKTGLGFWIHQMDAGASLHDVALGFVSSTEFQVNYANADNAAIVNKMYTNVLHRAPDAGGAQYWTDILNNQHSDVAGVLSSFSESPENQAALIGAIQNGIFFTPYI